MTQTIELNVNGARRVITADPGTPLIYVLRNDLKLKGTRFGCGAGVCGCCTVLLDGRGIQSCNTPLSAAEGREVTTIEGLGGKAAAHPLQQAFQRHHALQCGYCTPGMVMQGIDIVRRGRGLDEQAVRHDLEGNLCRCTGYQNIVDAIVDYAGSPAGRAAVQPGTQEHER